ncbi:DUF2977 domain-containing protein [Latilactobacillus curvatus]|uniref:DUF2977 domain-containing protein n=1 Tax=Latilactobacillus curvatus TaxID=28038 RepID=UPI0020C793C6|nr:DUF2977 domain-containing protein [Latilactobacillus curvatus]MCP8859429.1 DUF2977 domain-containing protein [Latilactobacillus curvatus]
MILSVNEKSEIIAYVEIGGMEGGIEYSGELPDDFRTNFKPKYYLLVNNSVVINSDYSEPIIEEPKQVLTQQDEINAHLFKMNLDLQLQLKELKSNE